MTVGVMYLVALYLLAAVVVASAFDEWNRSNWDVLADVVGKLLWPVGVVLWAVWLFSGRQRAPKRPSL